MRKATLHNLQAQAKGNRPAMKRSVTADKPSIEVLPNCTYANSLHVLARLVRYGG